MAAFRKRLNCPNWATKHLKRWQILPPFSPDVSSRTGFREHLKKKKRGTSAESASQRRCGVSFKRCTPLEAKRRMTQVTNGNLWLSLTVFVIRSENCYSFSWFDAGEQSSSCVESQNVNITLESFITPRSLLFGFIISINFPRLCRKPVDSRTAGPLFFSSTWNMCFKMGFQFAMQTSPWINLWKFGLQ